MCLGRTLLFAYNVSLSLAIFMHTFINKLNDRMEIEKKTLGTALDEKRDFKRDSQTMTCKISAQLPRF